MKHPRKTARQTLDAFEMFSNSFCMWAFMSAYAAKELFQAPLLAQFMLLLACAVFVGEVMARVTVWLCERIPVTPWEFERFQRSNGRGEVGEHDEPGHLN